MKRFTRIVLNLMVLSFLAISLSSCGYNSMVNKEEAVTGQWAQVENVYQRRLDLIPNLVKTVEGSADFERGTLTDVIEARAKATQATVNVDAGDLSPDKIQQFQQAQEQLSGALSRLLVSVERYPELRTTAAFQTLMSQLEGTENRISVERNKFNTTVQDYNSYIKRFPNNITAGLFGFESKGYFEASEGAERAPEVDFDFNDKEE